MNAKQIADRIVNKSGSYQEVMDYAEGMISPLITRSESLNNDNMDLRATLRDEIMRAEAAEARADMYAETIETLVNEKAQAEQERDELRRQLEQAQAALSTIIAMIEKSEPRPVHPGTGELLGRRPLAQQMIDIATEARS